jgi:hypothetical protein
MFNNGTILFMETITNIVSYNVGKRCNANFEINNYWSFYVWCKKCRYNLGDFQQLSNDLYNVHNFVVISYERMINAICF